jgi:hypothetical protein
MTDLTHVSEVRRRSSTAFLACHGLRQYRVSDMQSQASGLRCADPQMDHNDAGPRIVFCRVRAKELAGASRQTLVSPPVTLRWSSGT